MSIEPIVSFPNGHANAGIRSALRTCERLIRASDNVTNEDIRQTATFLRNVMNDPEMSERNRMRASSLLIGLLKEAARVEMDMAKLNQGHSEDTLTINLNLVERVHDRD